VHGAGQTRTQFFPHRRGSTSRSEPRWAAGIVLLCLLLTGSLVLLLGYQVQTSAATIDSERHAEARRMLAPTEPLEDAVDITPITSPTTARTWVRSSA